MKNSKKLLALFLSLGMTCSLAACGGDNQTSEGGLKIAICTSPNTVDDGSFNEDNYDGILNFIASRGNIDSVTPIQETTGESTAAVQKVSEVVADYDVLVCVGFQYGGIGDVAKENADKQFILVDSFPSDSTGATVELDNIYAMMFAEYQPGFFAGVTAALESTTNKVAVVNGVPFPSNVAYQYGFESGVNYANKHYNTTTEIVELPSYAGIDVVTNENIGGNYTGNFNDLAAGKVVGEALIREGCDIIFPAAGASGNGVITAIKEASGVKFIGCDVDQYDDGINGSDNVALTSVLKNMAINVERQLNAIADGSFKGGNYILAADTDSTGYVSAEGRQQLSENTLKVLAELYPLVQDGTIVPASTATDDPTNFPGL